MRGTDSWIQLTSALILLRTNRGTSTRLNPHPPPLFCLERIKGGSNRQSLLFLPFEASRGLFVAVVTVSAMEGIKIQFLPCFSAARGFSRVYLD